MIITIVVSVSAFLIVVVVAALFLNVHIQVHFSQTRTDTDGWLEISTLFGIVRYKRQLVSVKATMTDEGPAVQATHQVQGSNQERTVLTGREVLHMLADWQKWVQLFAGTWHQLKRLMRKFDVRELKVHAIFGTGDVVMTGIAHGAFCALVGGAIGKMTYLTRHCVKPDLMLHADFDKPEFQLQAKVMTRVRLSSALLFALRLAILWKRHLKKNTVKPRAPDAHQRESA